MPGYCKRDSTNYPQINAHYNRSPSFGRALCGKEVGGNSLGMKKEIYIIVRSSSSHIGELVNIKIKEGYMPLGGICVHSLDATHYQAMILREYVV